MNTRHFLPAALLGALSFLLPASPSFAQMPPPPVHGGKGTVKPITTTVPTSIGVTTNDNTTPTSVATVPVGYIQTVITPATDVNTPSSQVFSVPLYQPAVYAAPVTSVDTSTAFSSTSATWTANQFSQTGAPYLVHFNTGASAGRYFLIQSNTATQLTVYPRAYDLTQVVAAADTFEIVPANTVGSLFGTTSVPLLTGASASQADDLYLWNGTGYDIYFNNGTNWKRGGSLLNQNGAVIYPDEGISILRRSTAALTLTFTGVVPSTMERSDIPGPGSTFSANRFPVSTTLGALGLQNLSGWVSGASASQADNVYLWNGTGWSIFFYNGTHWKQGGNLNTFDTQPIPAGSAFFVTRQGTATGVAAALVLALPYTL